MKKLIISICLTGTILMQTGCATIFFGKETPCNTKPRKIHGGALVFDILTGLIPLIVDIADGHIYKPCDQQSKKDMAK